MGKGFKVSDWDQLKEDQTKTKQENVTTETTKKVEEK
jgi:hypothetical protein